MIGCDMATSPEEFIEANRAVMAEVHRQLGFRIISIDEERAVSEMGRSPFSTLGEFYAGPALMAFVEHAAGILPSYVGFTGDTTAPPLSICTQMSVSIISNSTADRLQAETIWTSRRRRLSVVETRVVDPSGRLVISASSSHMPL